MAGAVTYKPGTRVTVHTTDEHDGKIGRVHYTYTREGIVYYTVGFSDDRKDRFEFAAHEVDLDMSTPEAVEVWLNS